jgi:hypothetical protein
MLHNTSLAVLLVGTTFLLISAFVVFSAEGRHKVAAVVRLVVHGAHLMLTLVLRLILVSAEYGIVLL